MIVYMKDGTSDYFDDDYEVYFDQGKNGEWVVISSKDKDALSSYAYNKNNIEYVQFHGGFLT